MPKMKTHRALQSVSEYRWREPEEAQRLYESFHREEVTQAQTASAQGELVSAADTSV